MSLKIDQGLFGLDFTDCHAILGVPVDAEMKDIRKRYLNVVRRLHPDSLINESDEIRQQAAEMLSKLVNPAYEKLSQERNYSEYCVLLRIKGQQASKQQETVMLVSDPARRLAAANDIDVAYRNAMKELADRQYAKIDQAMDMTGEISELNLVYLMRKDSRGELSLGQTMGQTGQNSARQPQTSATPTAPSPTAAPRSPAVMTTEALVEACLRRAHQFEVKQDYSQAVLELREAIRMNPSSSNSHSRLGMVYLKTNQATMAKIHFNKALELNPQDPLALEGKRKLDSTTKTPKAAEGAKPAAKAAADKDKGSNKGGLFGLFGGNGKKK